MKHPLDLKKIIPIAAFLAVVASSSTANAQSLAYQNDFDTDDSLNWVVNTTGAPGTSTNGATFNFDYSTVGIPSAPHSTGGTTKGLKLFANIGTGGVFPAGVSASPTNFPVTDNFEMHWDMWLNYVKSGNGSTEIAGAGYGTAGTNAQIAGNTFDSTVIGVVTDQSASGVRVYGSKHSISYQNGYYVLGSDTTGSGGAPFGDPSSGYVYAGTNRDNRVGYYAPIFPVSPCPEAQTNLFPRQTGLIAAVGNCSFRWRDVSLRKVANLLTYRIDGNLIATVDTTDAGAAGGNYLLFNMFDVNTGGSSDIDSTNLQFALFDNVRVTNFASIVFVTNTAPATAEGSANDGVFTIIRTSTGAPITVNYTLGGSAVNGVDYTNLPGSVTLSAFATQTNIYVHPIDDSIAETTESVILTITPDPNFIAGGSATITISDNETPVLAITNVSTQMYEATNDYATFSVTRLGNTNSASFNVNLAFAGTATAGVDYYTNALVTFDPGFQTTNFNIYPIIDSTYEGNETATVTLAAGSGYTVGAASSASVTLVDADHPAETVLFSDDFDTDHTANWSLKFASTNADDVDYTADFAFDYSSQFIPPAPHGNGSTVGLRLTVNKDVNATAVAAGLNLYPNGQSFSGNYALRFDMLLNMISGASSTEYAICGLNHSGTMTNWWRSGGVPAGWTFDGVFYAIETDAQASPNFINYSAPTTVGNNPTALTAGTNSIGFANAFKSPPWAVAGSPAVNATSNNAVWADVELSQIAGVQTLSINKTVIFSYTNTTPYVSGNIMLGYVDAFDSRGTIQNYVVYDNVRVVSLAAPVITATQLIGGNAQIDFTAGVVDVVAQFILQAAPAVTGPYVDVSSTLTSPSAGNFRAVKSVALPAEFYRIRRIY